MDRQYAIVIWVYWAIAAIAAVGVSLIALDDFWGRDNWLYRYQTLITGGLAVVAAIFIYRAAIRQIEEIQMQFAAERLEAILRDNRIIAQYLLSFDHEVVAFDGGLEAAFSAYESWKSGDASKASEAAEQLDRIDELSPPIQLYQAALEIHYACRMVSPITYRARERFKDMTTRMSEERFEDEESAERLRKHAVLLARDRVCLYVLRLFLLKNYVAIQGSIKRFPAVEHLKPADLPEIAEANDVEVDFVHSALESMVVRDYIYSE